jgi:hypothetical protein
MKLYSLALLATVAVAQTPAPKPAPNGGIYTLDESCSRRDNGGAR